MKMNKIFLTILVVLVAFAAISDAQSRRRAGGRRRNRKGPNCHLKEIDKCMEKMESLGKRPEASNIITTAEGVEELCSTSLGTTDCIKGYMKKCGTPIQRELFDFILEQFVESVKQFCNDGDNKEVFLKHSPCINSKVIRSKRYHKKCVNDVLAAIYKGQEIINKTADDPDLFNFEKTGAKGVSDSILDLSCCSYNRFEDCANGFITKECGAEAVDAMNEFTTKTFGGGMNMICPRGMFDPKKKICTDIMPPTGTDPKSATLFNNALGKYALNYLNFLFNFDPNDTGAAAAAGAA